MAVDSEPGIGGRHHGPDGPSDAPRHAFDDSRRLTGPNRWYASTAVVLTPRGPAAGESGAIGAWAAQVESLCAALGWTARGFAPCPRAVPHPREPALAFAAPPDVLYTATEVNEWAWEQASGAFGAFGAAGASDASDAIGRIGPTGETQQTDRNDATTRTGAAAATGETEVAEPAGQTNRAAFDRAHAFDANPVTVFTARAAAESDTALEALRQGAAAHRLPLLVDDDLVSIGAGSGGCSWLRGALPAPAAVPWSALHAVPTVLVTGSNGKTTTVRLLAAMAQSAGLTAGHCSTEGVRVGDEALADGDYSGPAGARAVLRHPAVQAAVLETARGGILRRGLAVERADVAVVVNVSPDHLGEYGVESESDLAEVKLAVAHAVRHGTLVLNTDDGALMAAAARLPHAMAAPRALFARDHDHPALAALRAAGGSTCGGRNGELLLVHGGGVHALGLTSRMPLTLGDTAPHNIENAAAAALAAAVLGWPAAAIAATLARFGATPADNPGRLERWSHRGATVLVDYAHNPDGLQRLLDTARALNPHRLGLLLGQAGNRDDAAIASLAHTAAAASPDRVFIKELPVMRRGRAAGEVTALLDAALREAGLPAAHIAHEADETTAAHALLAWCAPGDVVVLPVHTAEVRVRLGAWLLEQTPTA